MFNLEVDHDHHNELPPWLVLHTFYGGLSDENSKEVDLSCGGAFMEYTIAQLGNCSIKSATMEKLCPLI
jgi:hypothetical protein